MELSASERVFGEGQNGIQMYFLTAGMLHYKPGAKAPEATWGLEDSRLDLRAGRHCCEVALWSEWTYLGTLESLTSCEVVKLGFGELQVALQDHVAASVVTHQFGEAFIRSALAERDKVLSDLGDQVNHDEIMSMMSKEARVVMADRVYWKLTSMSRQYWVVAASRTHSVDGRSMLLRDEVSNGKCHITFQGDEIVRTVFVVALRLAWVGDRSRHLVQVGDIHVASHTTTVKGVLPGTKRKGDEIADEAIRRLLQETLAPVVSFITLQDHERTTFSKDSPTYGIRTQYYRTTYNAVCADSFSTPGALVVDLRSFQVATEVADPVSTTVKVKSSSNRGPVRGAVQSDEAYKSPIQKIIEAVSTLGYIIVIPGRKGEVFVYLWLTDDEMEAVNDPSTYSVVKDLLEHVRSVLAGRPEYSSCENQSAREIKTTPTTASSEAAEASAEVQWQSGGR
eukprot:4190779-Amphidinium_carterae.1